jgi:hypothetical protein
MQVSKHATDRRMVISTIWIFVVLNYLFLNVLKILGGVGPTTTEEAELVNSLLTPDALLFSAIYLQMAMVMIVLSRVLKHGINRWANVIIATLHALGALASLLVATPTIHIFFVVFEVTALLFIAWFAWSWKNTV